MLTSNRLSDRGAPLPLAIVISSIRVISLPTRMVVSNSSGGKNHGGNNSSDTKIHQVFQHEDSSSSR